MKHIFKLLFVLLAMALINISCERDENGPLPDEGMKDGALAYVEFSATSDELVDVNNPGGFQLDYNIGTLWSPEFQKIQLVVVYNDVDETAYPGGDYAKQYVLVDDITSVPASGSIAMDQVIATVPELTSANEIKPGDFFHFFSVTYLNDGSVLKTFDRVGDLQGVQMIGTGLVDALSAVEGVTQIACFVPVPCSFDINDYIGTLTCVDTWWPGTFDVVISEDPDYTGDGVGLIFESGLADGAQNTPFKMEILMKNLSINIPQQTWFTGDFYGYGDSWLSGAGSVNTCGKQLEITIPGYRVAAGSFGGGTLTISKPGE